MAQVLVYSNADMALLIPIVAEAGHRVVEAYDSDEVVHLVLRGQFDIVMLPNEASPIDGLELLPLVRRLVLGAIVVVGHGDDAAIANSLLEGADAYLRHPVHPATLRIRLHTLLRRRPWVMGQAPGI